MNDCASSFPRKQLVVCAFHRPVKLDPSSLSVWAQIVLSHPSAVLWIISYEEYALQNLVRELESRSLSGRCSLLEPYFLVLIVCCRYIIAPKLPHDEQFIAKTRCDIFLDAVIYGAHGTAADAVWSGVPVLTIPSAQPQGRVAASLLLNHIFLSKDNADSAACRCLASGCTIARNSADALQLGRRLLARPAFLREMGICLHNAAASGSGIFDYVYWTLKALSGSRIAYEVAEHEESKKFHVIISK